MLIPAIATCSRLNPGSSINPRPIQRSSTPQMETRPIASSSACAATHDTGPILITAVSSSSSTRAPPGGTPSETGIILGALCGTSKERFRPDLGDLALPSTIVADRNGFAI